MAPRAVEVPHGVLRLEQQVLHLFAFGFFPLCLQGYLHRAVDPVLLQRFAQDPPYELARLLGVLPGPIAVREGFDVIDVERDVGADRRVPLAKDHSPGLPDRVPDTNLVQHVGIESRDIRQSEAGVVQGTGTSPGRYRRRRSPGPFVRRAGCPFPAAAAAHPRPQA